MVRRQDILGSATTKLNVGGVTWTYLTSTMEAFGMKAYLLTRYFDFRNAGIGRVSMEILKRLVEKGISVHKISTNGTSLYS